MERVVLNALAEGNAPSAPSFTIVLREADPPLLQRQSKQHLTMPNLATWMRAKDEKWFRPFFAKHPDIDLRCEQRRGSDYWKSMDYS